MMTDLQRHRVERWKEIMGRGDSSGKNPLSDNGKDVEGDKARV